MSEHHGSDGYVAVSQAPKARRRIWGAFLRAPSGVIALIVVTLLLLDAIFAPIFLKSAAETVNVDAQNQSPSWSHLLGTDQVGRDILARTLVAARVSVVIALGAAAIAFTGGMVLGIAAAVTGPRLRSFIQRFIDAMIAFPSLIVVILISTIIGTGSAGVTVGIGLAASFGFARVVSTLAQSVSGRDFISAARVLGVGPRRLMFRHVLPNIAEPLIVALAFILTFSLVASAGLSFLGLGVQPPQYDWGKMLTEGIRVLYSTPMVAFGPAIALGVSALAVGFFGEALAKAMNPLLWTDGAGKPAKRTKAPVTREPDHKDATAMLAAPGAAGEGDDPPALEVKDLVVTFPGRDGPVDVVKGVSFAVPRGGVLGIVGESGSGKTMTMLSVGEIVTHPGRVTGTIAIDGQSVSDLSKSARDAFLGKRLAYVFQDPMSSLNPALTVGRHLTERAKFIGRLGRRAASAAGVDRLRRVRMPVPERQMSRYPHELSGGMRQRTMIAMSLMTEPSVLVCDEPTTALDVTIQAQILQLLADINEKDRTAIVLISHDLAVVSQSCSRIIVMYAGRVVEELDNTQLLEDAWHPYTRALLRALPNVSRRDEALVSIPGDPPDPADTPSGCPFHPRCPLAMDRCRVERPELVREANGRRVACWRAGEPDGPDGGGSDSSRTRRVGAAS